MNPGMDAEFITVAELHKSFQMGPVSVHALAGVNLKIARNSFSLIMGPSGSGKSTLLYLLGGLDRPSSGKIIIGGESIDAMDENALAGFRRKTVGFIFQSFNLVPSMTALDNIIFPMRFAGISARQRRTHALELLERVGLADRAYHRPNELSGGQQQRVAIARALVNRPQIILADEPTGNLDTSSGENIMELLASLHREGVTIVLVSHDPRMRGYATHVVEILDGLVVANGAINQPAGVTVAASAAEPLPAAPAPDAAGAPEAMGE